jgi:SAM-dependent methyltransferase
VTRRGAERYRDSCRSALWRGVFAAEVDYLARELSGSREVLSVGCGPGDVEAGLAARGFSVTGLDASREALAFAPARLRRMAASAEAMPLRGASFDAVIFVASLQFVEGVDEALDEARRVLRPGGRMIALLLDPGSAFFRERAARPGSYVSRIRHPSTDRLETAIRRRFASRSERLLGVEGGRVFESAEPGVAALLAIVGTKREGACE